MANVAADLKESPSQTAGPYVHIGLTPNYSGIAGVYPVDLGGVVAAEGVRGERIVVAGRITDGAGVAVNDAVVELWQADADGRYSWRQGLNGGAAPDFTGWGRQPTDADGVFRFSTIRPGRVRAPDGSLMAPHLSLWIVARGINVGLNTRLYFDDEAEANAEDYLLRRIPDPARRATLIARREAGEGGRAYRFDIRLQGEGETVFLDV